MKKYHFFDSENLSIVSISTADFIHQYGKTTITPKGVAPMYFYDEEDHKIYSWHSGQKSVAFGGCTFSKTQADDELFKLALDEVENLILCEDLNEAKEQAASFLELAIEEEWDEETINRLKSLTVL